MQYKALATIVFAAAAIAAPAEFDLDDLKDYQDIASAVESAVPTAWAQSLYTDPGFAKSVLSDLDAGTYPPWFSSLPSDVRSDAPAASEVAKGYSSYIGQLGSLGVLSSITATGSGSATRTVATTTAPSTTVTSGTSTSTVTTSKGSSSTSGSASGSASDSASDSASGSATGSGSGSASGSAGATDTSTGGAPAATGHVAMGLAGAAGVLGLALAL